MGDVLILLRTQVVSGFGRPRDGRGTMYVLFAFVIIAVIATTAVLAVGIYSMARGGESDMKHSVQLMSARVWLQGAAVLVIILAAMYFGRMPW